MTPSTLWLAGGCFWGVEAFLSRMPGVLSTEVGYANGRTERPTYRQVCHENTGHAEAVKVVYDRETLPTDRLLRHFFDIIDPVAFNRQGNDVGSQYRSGIYHADDADRDVALAVREEIQRGLTRRVMTEVKPLENWWPAEEYHQKYLEKNPNGYCHIDFSKLPEAGATAKDPDIKKESREALRKRLTPEQWRVTQQSGTEAPFTSPLYRNEAPGLYVDVASGEPLFSSRDKFDAGCGWPSFTRPLTPAGVRFLRDLTHGMDRTEVRSAEGDSHLGHVFDDGPRDRGGKRYCINGAALRFVPLERMESEGYGEWIAAVEPEGKDDTR